MTLRTAIPDRRKRTLRGFMRLAAVAAIVAPVIWAMSVKVPDTVDTTLTPDADATAAVPIELSYADYPNASGSHIATMRFDLTNAETLVRHDALHILVATLDTTPQLERAELSMPGTECTFRTRTGAVYPNNSTLAFVRGKSCYPLRGAPTGQLLLTVHFSGPGRLALWTYRPPPTPPDPDVIYVPDPTWSELGLRVMLRGHYVDDRGMSGYRRADLLNYMWGVSGSTTWLWCATGASVVLLMLGALALPHRDTRGRLLRACLAGFLLSGGISLLYVVLVPPFQAPDEPSHFLGYGYVTDDSRLASDALEWAKRSHFGRLRFHPDQRFRPVDVGEPYPREWSEVFVVDVTRSSITTPFWRRMGGVLKNLSVPQKLLTLRLINAVVFSLTVAVCTAIVAVLSTARRPEAAVSLLLLVPTLPFFGTYLSNYAVVVAAYAIVASACLVLFLDGPRAHFAGLPLGLGLAVAAVSTRNALPMVLLLALVVLGRVVLRGRGEGGGNASQRAIFWGGVLAGVAVAAVISTERYTWRMGVELERLSSRATSIAVLALAHPWLLAGAAALAIALVEASSSAARWALAAAIHRRLPRWIAPACIAGMAAVALPLAASPFVELPHLTPARGTVPVTVQRYVLETLATVATPFRFRDPDFLLSTTFWGAFGWVDTLLPPFVLALLSVGTGMAAIAMLRRLSISRDVRRFCWLLTIVLAFFVTVAAYAAATFWMSPDLHGRYLIGPYLVALMVAWSPALAADEYGPPVSPDANRWLALGAWLLMAAGHSSALLRLVTRYV